MKVITKEKIILILLSINEEKLSNATEIPMSGHEQYIHTHYNL